jgi:conjugal transfer pilus assembly protein TraF
MISRDSVDRKRVLPETKAMQNADRITVAILGTLLCAASMVARAESDNWWRASPWEDPDRGYWWYPPDKLPSAREKEKAPEKPRALEEIRAMEELRVEVERRHSEAIMNPTEENVLSFLEAQNFAMNKAAIFADVGRRITWQHPEVDYTARAPVANFARSSFDRRKTEAQEQHFRKLTETHAILYFARSDCPMCADEAPVLKGLSLDTGMQVLAVSLDGKPMYMFPDAKPDNGISMTVSGGQGIKALPALYLIDRESQRVIPLASGAIAAGELKERIWVLTKTTPGQNF